MRPPRVRPRRSPPATRRARRSPAPLSARRAYGSAAVTPPRSRTIHSETDRTCRARRIAARSRAASQWTIASDGIASSESPARRSACSSSTNARRPSTARVSYQAIAGAISSPRPSSTIDVSAIEVTPSAITSPAGACASAAAIASRTPAERAAPDVSPPVSQARQCVLTDARASSRPSRSTIPAFVREVPTSTPRSRDGRFIVRLRPRSRGGRPRPSPPASAPAANGPYPTGTRAAPRRRARPPPSSTRARR